MGIFDFFKKKKTSEDRQPDLQPVNNEDYIILLLKAELEAFGYTVAIHNRYRALLVNSELEIATAIIESPGVHHAVLHLMVATIHPVYFPDGIVENIVGIGTTIEQKAETVIDNYISSTFKPIIDGMSDSHNPDLDFSTHFEGQDVLWHPKPGDMILQGQWDFDPDDLYDLVKGKVNEQLENQKINWLKLYVSKQPDGKIIGECLFNNEHWEEGYDLIRQYANTWPTGSFLGAKQFVVFRKCDAFD